jgi:hypothetical protein
LTLTTPIIEEADACLPGENWFFYWKTSSRLWREKLSSPLLGREVFIPLFWGLHSETGQDYDFGHSKPETNLKSLVEICKSLKKEVIFLFPLGPMPFLMNGGIPSLLARCPAVTPSGFMQSAINADQKVIRMYSPYDSRIFQGYAQFAEKLSSYLVSAGISAQVWGLSPGYFENEEFKDFFEDRSPIFFQALNRYVRKKNQVPTENPLDENLEDYISEYQTLIRDLYLNSAKEALSTYWEGEMPWSFLGLGQKDFLQSLFGFLDEKKLTQELFLGLKNNVCFSSCLLGQSQKGKVLTWQMNDVVKDLLIPDFLQHESNSNTQVKNKLLSFFTLLTKPGQKVWEDLGLVSFLNEFFKHTYELRSKLDFKKESMEDDFERETGASYYFVNGQDLSDSEFSVLLKIFMNGGQIVLASDSLQKKHEQRIEAFILENELNVETLKQDCPIRLLSLGDGRIFLIDFKHFKEEGVEQKFKFWDRLISTLGLRHIMLDEDRDIDYLWLRREAGGQDLSYEEIRRLKLYNSSSYKKSVKIKIPEHFVLIKYLDSVNSELISKQHELTITLNPKSMIGLDFGVFQ